MRIRTVTGIVALALGCVPGATHAQNLINGSFELGTDPNTGPGQNLGLFAPDTTTITGWTVSSGSVDYIGSRWAAGDGGRSLDLSGVSAGTILQDVGGFTPGMAYELSFLLAANPEGGPSTKSLQVGIDGLTQIFSSGAQGSASDPGWTRMSFGFTASSPTLTLTFTSLENNASGPALDGVRIAAVPEPGPLSLCAAAGGLSALGLLRRRFQRKESPDTA